MFWFTRMIPVSVMRSIMDFRSFVWNMKTDPDARIWQSIIVLSLIAPVIIRYVIFKLFFGLKNKLSLVALILTNILFYVFLYSEIISLGPSLEFKMLWLIAFQTGIEYLIWHKCSKDKKGIRLVLASVLSIIIGLLSVALIVVMNVLSAMTLEGMW